jgi:CRP-like cAMP-binding protein
MIATDAVLERALDAVTLLHRIGADHRAHLVVAFKPRDLQRDEELVRAGDVADGMIAILSGCAVAQDDPVRLRVR